MNLFGNTLFFYNIIFNIIKIQACLIFILLVFCVTEDNAVLSKKETSLQFVSYPNLKNRISYELDTDDIRVDANIQNQILIKYIQLMRDKYDVSLMFYCFVKELGNDDLIMNAQFCRKLNVNSKEECHTITKNSLVKFGGNITFDVTFDNKTGIKALLCLNQADKAFKHRKEPYDGLYFCKLSNFVGAIKSNFIEFQDYEYYRTKISSLVKPLSVYYNPIENSNVNINDLPVEYRCGEEMTNIEADIPSWLDRNLVNPFMWKQCEREPTGIDCDTFAAQYPTKINNLVDYHKDITGKISIMNVNSDVGGMRLICLSTNTPTTTYAIHFGKKTASDWIPILIDSSGPYSRKIMRITPAENVIKVREGTYKINPFKLSAQYVVNPDKNKRTVKWTKDSYALPYGMVLTDYDVTFPNEVKRSHSGKYVLSIKQSQPKDEKTITFNVDVVGVPYIKNPDEFSKIIYIMEDQTANLEVSFDGKLTNKTIEVNNIELDLSSFGNKVKSLQNIKKTFPLLSGIHIDAKIENNKFKYTAKNLSPNVYALRAKTHTVSFVAENDIGVSRASTLIRVFILPKYTHYPKSYICTSKCLNAKDHKFLCKINQSVFESEGLKVHYYWFLNDKNLNRMTTAHIAMSYMEVKGDTVILKKLTTNDRVRDQKMIYLLKRARLSCMVHITQPNNKLSNPIYDSSLHHEVKRKLQAVIAIKNY